MIGFFTRLWIVLRLLRYLARRGELKPLLKAACVLSVKDLQLLLHLTLAKLLVRVAVHNRRKIEESLEFEANRQKQLMDVHRLAKKPPVKWDS